jgi:uncharacterized OB-fold protein
MCPSCHSTTLEWIDAGDHGTIHTFSVYYRAFHPAFADKLPYAVASVRMEPGVIVFGEYAGDPETISIGTPVRGECFTITPEVALLRWVPDLPEVLPDSLKKNQGE